MPKWLHRTTKQFLSSVPSAELPEPVTNYIEEPNLTTVTGQPSKYWKVVGDNISLMNQAERDAADAAEAIVIRDDVVARDLDRSESVLRAFAQVVVDEINLLRSQHGLDPRTLKQLRDAIRNKLGT